MPRSLALGFDWANAVEQTVHEAKRTKAVRRKTRESNRSMTFLQAA